MGLLSLQSYCYLWRQRTQRHNRSTNSYSANSSLRDGLYHRIVYMDNVYLLFHGHDPDCHSPAMATSSMSNKILELSTYGCHFYAYDVLKMPDSPLKKNIPSTFKSKIYISKLNLFYKTMMRSRNLPVSLLGKSRLENGM